MRISFVAVIASALALPGCTTLPKAVDPIPVSYKEIIQAVECELGRIVDPGSVPAGFFHNQVAATSLDLVGTDTGKITPGLDVEQTVGTTKVTMKPSSELSDTLTTTQHLEFVTPFNGILPGGGEARALLEKRCPPLDSPLSARGLGLADYVRESVASIAVSQPTLIKFTRDFTVTRSAGGGLVFETTLGKLSFDETKLSAEQHNTITVKIDLSKAQKNAPGQRPVDKGDVDKLTTFSIQLPRSTDPNLPTFQLVPVE